MHNPYKENGLYKDTAAPSDFGRSGVSVINF
jgi:hypothetical protein